MAKEIEAVAIQAKVLPGDHRREYRMEEAFRQICHLDQYAAGYIQAARHPEGWMLIDYDPECDGYEMVAGPFPSRGEARAKIAYYASVAEHGGCPCELCMGSDSCEWSGEEKDR